MTAGENWKTEVQSSHVEQLSPEEVQKRYEARLNFYKDRVQNKLGETFDDIVGDALLKGYKTLEQHKEKTLNQEIKAGDTLFAILRDFYKDKFSLDPEQAKKEAYLSLAHVMKNSGANVDELELGWTVSIENGLLSIQDAQKNNPTGINKLALRPEGIAAPGERPDGAVAAKQKEEAPAYAMQAGAAETAVEADTETIDQEAPHITALKERLKAFNGQYVIDDLSDKEVPTISLKSGPYLQLAVEWNNSSKEWILPEADLHYEKPEEAFADLLFISKAEKIWTHNMSNAAPGEDPFYMGDTFIMYKSDWLDEGIASISFGDKGKILTYINKLYKENVKAKEVQTREPRPEESENGMKARNVIRSTMENIPLDFTYTLINSTKVNVSAKGVGPIHISWDEATKAWVLDWLDFGQTEGEDPYSDSNLDNAVKEAYRLMIASLDKPE